MKDQHSNQTRAGVSALALGLALLGNSPAQASLIGDEVRLDVDFNSPNEIFETDFFVEGNFSEGSSGGEATAIVEEGPSLFAEGLMAEGPESEFLSSTAAFSEGDGDFFGVGSFTSSFALFNVEDSSIEGLLSNFWELEADDIDVFSWEYTFSDLGWVDFPDGRIVGAELSPIAFPFGEGPFGEGPVSLGEGVFSEGFVVGEGDDEFSFAENLFPIEDYLNVTFTDDSVTLAATFDPLFPFSEDPFLTAPFTPVFAEGFSETAFNIALDVEHSRTVPTPAMLPGLIGMGMGILQKRKKLAEASNLGES